MNRKSEDPRALRLFRTYLQGLPAAERKKAAASELEALRLFRDFCFWLIEEMWKDAEPGFLVKRGAAIGHTRRYGTRKQKGDDRNSYQAEVDRVRAAHADWSKANVIREAAKKFSVSESTVKRYTTDPGRKKK